MSGDPKFEGSQSLPDFPYASYAEMLGLRGIRVDDPDDVGARLGPGAGRRPAGRPRGGDRSGGAAAAAAHHDRAGEGAHLGVAQGRPPCAGGSSSSPSSRRSKSSCPGDEHRRRRRGARGDGRCGRLHDPDGRAGGRRHAELGRDDDRRRRTSRRGGHAGVGYTYADAATATLIDSKLAARRRAGPTRWPPPAIWAAMVSAIRNLGRPGIASMAISAVDVGALGSQGAAARRRAVHAARRRSRPRCRSTAAAASPPTTTSGCRRSSPAGSRPGSRG